VPWTYLHPLRETDSSLKCLNYCNPIWYKIWNLRPHSKLCGWWSSYNSNAIPPLLICGCVYEAYSVCASESSPEMFGWRMKTASATLRSGGSLMCQPHFSLAYVQLLAFLYLICLLLLCCIVCLCFNAISIFFWMSNTACCWVFASNIHFKSAKGSGSVNFPYVA
jgi:hypothetical protein